MIQGSLRDAAISDVFQIVSGGRKTGVLTVARRDDTARIYFDEGRVQCAYLAPGIHLGEILVRLELLTAYEVQQVLRKQTTETPDIPLGTQALELGFLTMEELQTALKAQVLEVLTELMHWKSGTFTFTEGAESRFLAPPGLTFEAQMLLLEVASRLEGWQEGRLAAETVFDRHGDPTKLELPKGAWEVLGYVDSRRSAGSIAAELDLPEREVYRILLDLEECGAIRRSPFQIHEPLVLVVAASSALLRIMRLALKRARLRPILAHDFDAALSAMASHKPQAVVIDDDAAGAWEFVRDYRRTPGQGHLPALMLVQNDTPGGWLGRFKTRRVRMLKKPFQEIDLQQAVSRMVGHPL